MRILASSETVSIESDSENAQEGVAKYLLNVFSQYELEDKEAAPTICEFNTDRGVVKYYCYQKTIN